MESNALFCGKEPSYTNILVPSPFGDTYICSECVDQIEGLLKDYYEENPSIRPDKAKGKNPKPPLSRRQKNFRLRLKYAHFSINMSSGRTTPRNISR